MASLLFKLNSVPDDEADEIRALLTDAQIDYYETSAGNWGLSFAAIWLSDLKQQDQAQELIDDYQQERHLLARKHVLSLKQMGEYPTRWQVFMHSPIKIVAVVIFVVVLIYFSITPFFYS